ncbi:MAG: serine/threonine-protein kinase [Planctomycetota bacterium JB042]
MTTSVPPPVGDESPVIPGYDIVRPLGKGGMGVVYLGWQEALERFVALKVLRADLREDPQVRARFVREARALSQVQHPHVVPLHAFGQHGDTMYMSMAYVLGETISEALEAARSSDESRIGFWFERIGTDGRRANVASCVVAQAVADALDDLHSVGIVHRDVKPANIVVDAKGRPVLVDFGLACDREAEAIGSRDGPIGTPRYLAPELMDARADELDARADVYALGATLFEMLTLRPAFPQTEMGDLVDAIRNGEPPSAREVEPSVPRSLDAIVRRALEKDPRKRFQSARGMAAALRAAKADLSRQDDLSCLALAPDLQRALDAPAPRSNRRRRQLLVGGLAVLAGGLAFAAGVAVGGV